MSRPDRRQERAHLVDDVDARRVGELAEQRRADAAGAEREPEEQPETVPTRPGTSSCANTTIAEKAEARMRPMTTVSISVQNRLA